MLFNNLSMTMCMLVFLLALNFQATNTGVINWLTGSSNSPAAQTSVNHEFATLRGASRSLDNITSTIAQSDVTVLMMGDTQFFIKCTDANTECKRKFSACGDTERCVEQQSRWANNVQKQSIQAFHKLTNHVASGLLILGDLTNWGHWSEHAALEQVWIHAKGLPTLYPGLGNHDYDNNVDDCAFQLCALRMLSSIHHYIDNELHINNVDVKQRKINWYKKQFRGSLSYSWNVCQSEGGNDNTNCYHFVQLHNYPTYVRSIDSYTEEWRIESSLRWLRRDLNSTTYPVTLTLHDFDNGFKTKQKKEFYETLAKSNRRILGVFFAHYHDLAGMRGTTCVGTQRVPLFYAGSVPANNYISVSYRSGELEQIAKMHVENDTLSRVSIVSFKQSIEDECNAAKKVKARSVIGQSLTAISRFMKNTANKTRQAVLANDSDREEM